jgi:membrane protein YdbS with pleckstrin-like domain
MSHLHDMKFSVRGFSVRRMAYLIVGIDFLLVPLHVAHSWAGFHIDELLLVVAVAAMLITLILGLFIPRKEKHRFLPFALGVVAYAAHALFSPA